MKLFAKKRLLAMSRPRADMVKLIKSSQDPVEEHIWKIAAYGELMPLEIPGWTQSIRKYIPRLRIYNVKSSNAVWFNQAELNVFFDHQLFGGNEVEVMNHNFNQFHGYPLLPEASLPAINEHCRILALRFVDCIVKLKPFEVNHE